MILIIIKFGEPLNFSKNDKKVGCASFFQPTSVFGYLMTHSSSCLLYNLLEILTSSKLTGQLSWRARIDQSLHFTITITAV